MNSIISVYPVTKEHANGLISSITKVVKKFINYNDLYIMMVRYKDILTNRLPNLLNEISPTEKLNEKSEKNGKNGQGIKI